MSHKSLTTPLPEAPRDVKAIAAQEKSCHLPHWNTDIAFRLGTMLRARLQHFDNPAVIHISTISTPPHILFQAVSRNGTNLDNDYWVARKRKSVIRWGVSTWQLHNKYGGDEAVFAQKNGLGGAAGEYAIHGGGVPIFVTGSSGMVAVVVVSGLKQWDDHMIVIEALEKLAQELKG